jgi:hypothetical protein
MEGMMGREIRKVPANWQHPVVGDDYGRLRKKPMFDRQYEVACTEWLADFDRIRAGDLKGYEVECYPLGVCQWAADNHAPSPDDYRPWPDDEAVWWQLWETVSEGTPVTPAFASADELIDYLAQHGDEWDQKRCIEPDWVSLWGGVPGVSGWGRERAERFVRHVGWAPSMVIADGKIMTGVEAMTA